MEFKYYDISPVISSRLAVFPGDATFQRNISLSFKRGEHLELSSINTTLHLGAHADAPNHYNVHGEAIHQRSLSYYYGPAQVVRVNLNKSESIVKQHLAATEIKASRILFSTDSFPDPEKWNSDFNSLSVELIEYLFSKNVKLVGIDTPSIDPETSKELPAHNAIYKNNMAILEGLILSHVPEGLYQLVALPLRLEGCDASPVRAILVDS
ncbi:MAG: cyclase family protein [Bdellovibrionales bacterium]|nr:cyclase family protein [Bdellovibrionales bacterium]